MIKKTSVFIVSEHVLVSTAKNNSSWAAPLPEYRSILACYKTSLTVASAGEQTSQLFIYVIGCLWARQDALCAMGLESVKNEP